MPDLHPQLSRRAPHLIGSIIDSSISLLARQEHDIVRFAMGAPSDDLMPVELLDEIAGLPAPGKYSYGNTEGEPRLVDEICKLLAGQPAVSEDRITVTTGGMQGLDLACKLFIDPGDLVLVEGPTYTNAYATALSYGADVREVPLDEDGLIVDLLPEIARSAGRTPKAIYTIPNFQNPSGVTLSEERRVRLLELAESWGSVIIDDDPYGMLGFAGGPVPSLRELSAASPLIFSVRTFSKILAPGLRIGWVDADPSLRPLLLSARQAMDTCTSVPTQLTVTEFLRRGHLEVHLDRVRSLYRERKEAMIDALDRRFGDAVRTTDPDGGFFLWVTFADEGLDSRLLFEPALAAGVAFIPGPAFSPEGHFANAMRLCFATSPPERIDLGVRRLGATIDTAPGVQR
jgi:2-aminoadipate transaminase